MGGRKIRDERDARDCLRRAQRSPMGLPAWAAAHGIDARSLNAWHQNFRRREPKPVQLVEVVAPATQPAARYALIVGETRLEFGDDCSEVTLRRVLQALRPC